MAMTTGFGQSSISSSSGRRLNFAVSRRDYLAELADIGAGDERTSAPMMTMALTAGSAAAFATEDSMPSGTPGLRALTGRIFDGDYGDIAVQGEGDEFVHFGLPGEVRRAGGPPHRVYRPTGKCVNLMYTCLHSYAGSCRRRQFTDARWRNRSAARSI